MSDLKTLIQTMKNQLGFETVQPTATESQLRLIGRVDKLHAKNWKAALDYLLLDEQNKPWSLDISQQYFLRGGTTVFAWRLIIQAPDLESHLPKLINTVKSAPSAQFSPAGTPGTEVIEQPLSVIGPRTAGTNARGKGASTAGTPPLIMRGGLR